MSASNDYHETLTLKLLDSNSYDEVPRIKQNNEKEKDQIQDSRSKCKLIIVLCLNTIFLLSELIFGFIIKSLSLQSDSLNKLFNEVSLITGLVCNILFKKKASEKMTFGWERMEILGGLCNAVLLMSLCLTTFCDSVEYFMYSKKIDHPFLFIIVGASGIVINIIGMIIFHDNKKSFNLKGVFIHIIWYFLSSICVIISASVIYFTNWKYRYYIDPAISAVIVIFLFYFSIVLIKQTAKVLIDSVPVDINLNHIHQQLLQIPGIVSIHEPHVWEISHKYYYGFTHVVASSKDESQRIIRSVNDVMKNNGVHSITVQLEYLDDFPKGIDCNNKCLCAVSFGNDKRCFETLPVYKHKVGCPHVNIPGQEESSSCTSHDHNNEEK